MEFVSGGKVTASNAQVSPLISRGDEEGSTAPPMSSDVRLLKDEQVSLSL